ncbi:MAG: sigma-54 dependent transcriptional regulator [Desulforhopalus sp.]|jgi:two-component system nitrogen regulation response regulator NtrX|nr:sigma-54 dependent transcriptional regulator [Desulforhopalus sp.]
MSKRILIIDDEVSIQQTLAGILEDEGFTSIAASSAEEGLELLEGINIDLVLLDIWLGDNMDGMTALEKIRERFSMPVIMISGHGTIETAVQATRKGAFDFVEKPLSYDKIILAITNGLRFARLEQENLLLRQGVKQKSILTGESEVIKALKKQIEMVAPTDAWVLIRGEHGTGKELVAQSIHRFSKSSDQPMIEVNCAAIPEELIESELFGHEKGSFTGAHISKRGKFDQADGGILFLDEIGDMSLNTQAKILRILQEQKFERVGGSKTIKVNVRVLAATNKNLEEEIEAGHFRADLFWRLNVVPIHVPPLQDRLDDIPLLVHALMQEMISKGLKQKKFSADAYQAMMAHRWPGNVRELRNFVERLVIMCQEPEITATQVRMFLSPAQPDPATTGNGTPLSGMFGVDYKTAKKIFEREYLLQKLLQNDNNISKTAEQVGLERSHLHKKLKTYDIIH